jgi:ribosomal protein S18 acetylase RimI-like enzyme
MSREAQPGSLGEWRRPELRVSSLVREQEADAAEVLARAFCDEPMSCAVIGGSGARRLRSNRFGMRQALLRCRDHGVALVAEAVPEPDGLVRNPQGVLVALPPGVFPLPSPPLGAQLRSAFVQGFRTVARWGEVYAELAAVHPREPHWYLSLLAASPAVQRQGIGSGLLQRWLEQVDATGAGTYLETDLESNVRFYGRAGFEVRDELRVLGLRVWCLWRPPVVAER